MSLEDLLRRVLEDSERGVQTELAANTDLHQSEIANWFRGDRPLPAPKLIQAIDYFIAEGVISIDLEISRRG